MQRNPEKTPPFNDKKIVGIIAVLVLLGLFLIFVTNTTNNLLSGARTFVGGEGIWSKAQKQGALYLVRYVESEDNLYYSKFDSVVAITEGYRQAREELIRDDTDVDVVHEGFQQARSNPDDINYAIWMYENLSWTSSMKESTEIWLEAERLMQELAELGELIRQDVNAGGITTEERDLYLNEIYRLDTQLTRVENKFSGMIDRSAVQVSNVVYWFSLCIGLLLLLAGGFVSIRFIRNAKKWGASIKASEQKFRSVLENTKDVIYQLDLKKKQYVYMSPSIGEMLGYSSEEVISRGPEFIYSSIHPEDKKRLEAELKEVRQNQPIGNYSDETEFRIKTSGGEYIWINNRRSIIFDENGESDYLVGNARDISERKKYERKIDDALEEKKVLLQEIHHRVKNNLAVISGILFLQKEELDEPAREAFQKMQARIDSVAMIHEKLYGSESLSEIDLGKYIDELSAAISAAYMSDDKVIELEKDLDSVSVEIGNAVSFGLAINELVNNAYKHAFANKEGGKIRLSLKQQGEVKILTVADNGKGLPDNFPENQSSSLGMTLVNSLLGQIDADLQVNTGQWTEFVITFN